MSDMTREQVLELAYEDLPWWPASGKGAREFVGNRFRDTQWRFGVIGHADEAFLFHERFLSISLQDIVAHAKKDRPEEWNGEGLPPVGAVVEFSDDSYWIQGEVIMHRKGEAIVVDIGDDSCITSAPIGKFRPIRSEREKAVEEMIAVTDEHLAPEDTCRALYDAGYRKAESGDEC